MGADLTFENEREEGGEPVADLRAKFSPDMKGVEVPPERAASMIDEFPVLSVVAANATGATKMLGVKELRVKESDRIDAMARGLEDMGVTVEETEDTFTVHGMGPGGVPGGGRTDITKRLMRHFNVIYTPPFDEDSLHKIFTSILEWGMRDANESLQRQIKKLTKATIRVYNDVCASLLPLPSKPHYTYNLRCISELFQSFLCMDPRIVAQQDNKLEYMYRLWVHECMRVFADRLVSDADREQVVEIVKVVGEDEELPGVKWNRIDVESLVFSNFKEWNPALTELVYDEITGLDNDKRIEEIIEVYNLSNKDKMQLLMFEYLVQHLARISRIIAKPYGNALLVGIGGNGRNSVSRLASFINGCQLYRVSPAR